MNSWHRNTLLIALIAGVLMALMFNAADGQNNPQAVGDEIHEGTFEEPRVINEPAYQGAVFFDTSGAPGAFYIASFDSEPGKPNPAFPETPQSSEYWTYAGQHSGLGPDLKPFTEPTRIDAFHLAQIDGKNALLRSKINGLPSPQTPYPTTPASNDFWAFIGFFEKAGTEGEMKSIEDLAWPGVFMRYAPNESIYVALRTGNPVIDAWPAPDSVQGSDYWKFAGNDSAIGPKFPKPWTARSIQIGSYYHQPLNALRHYYWASGFIGFPVLMGAVFPQPAQSNDLWVYKGRHEGSPVDPKAFGEPQAGNRTYRARVAGKWVVLSPKDFEGAPSADTPYPSELKSNEFWNLGTVSVHAGNWQDPRNDEDDFTQTGQIHAQPHANGLAFFRSLATGYVPENSQWQYSDTSKWQSLGLSIHAGTVADPKGQDELTWPGAVHAVNRGDETVYFRSLEEGNPAENDWPLPTNATDNKHWQIIGFIPSPGTFEEPQHFDSYSQPGAVYVDNLGNGQRNYYISRIGGYPAEDIDSFATVGQADPNWEFAGRHSGLMTDLKPFTDITRIGAFHEAEIQGQRVLVRSNIAGWPSSSTPYPITMTSTEHWEVMGVFKHAGTVGDFKGRDDMTWPGALHLDEGQQIVFAAKLPGDPGPEGWVYPSGETSDERWDFVTSLANSGTVDSPRERNSLSTPGTIFADQRGVNRQKLYRSKFTGFADELGAFYPSGSEANEFYEYVGDHAGTFTDPKPFNEPTWSGAIHQTTIEGKLAFLKAKFDGTPSVETPYPGTLAGNEFWDFEFTTEQAGTNVDPKNMVGNTWPGAVHEYVDMGRAKLYAAKQFGNPEADGWPNPVDPTGVYWKFIGINRHKGTFADPKEFDEATGIGLIHKTTINGVEVFFRSLVNGEPADNGWAYPETETSNENWEYLGRNSPEGTWADPKGPNAFTWLGRIHAVQIGDKRVYLGSKVDGLPAEHDWPYPETQENAYWWVAGESRHSGTFINPKDQQEVTWVGAIHMRQEGERKMYYRNKLIFGNLEVNGSIYPLPDGEASNDVWEYLGANSNAGTLDDPLVGEVLTWPGNTHKKFLVGGGAYYLSRFTGISDASHPLPAFPPHNNESWIYVGYSNFPGTVLMPKSAAEITWPGAVHRFEEEGKTYYIKSKFNGIPPESGWVYPGPSTRDERWEYPEMGEHPGTWIDPKPLNDATWPGAIHLQKSYLWVNNSWVLRRSFFRAKLWGRGSMATDGYLNTAMFESLGFSVYQGTLDSPKYFDQPTWAGAIHFDRTTHLFFEARQSGQMGIDVGPQPDTATSNHYWLYLGEQKHLGDIADPKQWDEYTWPGRIHNYDIGRTILYFSARMTGTPSEHNWHYPTDESSNDQWAYIGRTDHAGTFGDPHVLNEVTWKGAVHTVGSPGSVRYFSALFAGNGQELGYSYPQGENSNLHWKFLASSTHAGTLGDPLSYGREPVWPGAIVINTRAPVGRFYYLAKNDGIPADNEWPLPTGEVANENWDYFGASKHAGTESDPKPWDEVTWSGALNYADFSGVRALFSPRLAGIPSDNGWSFPTRLEDNEHWIYSSFVHVNGTFANPKSYNDITDLGLIHVTGIAGQRMYFAAKFKGQANPPDKPSAEPEKAFPGQGADNAWWKFMRRTEGTVDIPNGWYDYSMAGDVNEYFIGGMRLLFIAKQEGRPSDFNWYYPAFETDNAHWRYLSTHQGTNDDPKEWREITYKNDFHRYWVGDKTLIFKAKKEGYPASLGLYPLAPDQDTDVWAYAGLHTGTRQDPKGLGEPTWSKAIHWKSQDNRYFESRFSGISADYPPGSEGDSRWVGIDTSSYAAPGINDFSKPFDEYVWVTAHNAYLDSLTGHLRRGIRGLMLDTHMDDNPYSHLRKARMCHSSWNTCSVDNDTLASGLAEVLAFLKQDRNAVITLHFESSISHDYMQAVLNEVPELGAYVYNRDGSGAADINTWAALQWMIGNNQRLVLFSDGQTPGTYSVAGRDVTILRANSGEVENTYNLGNTAITHDWECKTRYDDLALSLRKADGTFNRLFVLNQFHAFGSSTAHAGDVDNNLTRLQRRVERYCGLASGWRKPNYLAIDFNQVGDAFAYAAALTQGGFYFYEGNNSDRDRDTVCVLPAGQSAPGNGMQYDLRLGSHGCEEDEIRSMELDGISAGTRIELYDSPSADRQDDFTIIDVKQSVPLGQRVRINSLQSSEDNFWYRKLAFRNNGLDGKISRIKIRTSPAVEDFSDAQVVFYEEVDAQQNIVCTVPFIRINIKNKDNSYGCDNDEIDSAVIVQAKAGSYFSVVGHPHGEYKEGLGEVRVKKDILIPLIIGNFESNFENEYVKVTRCRGHKLGGKISFMYFWPEGHALDCGE